MNRADLLLSVLQDGREHSRADIVSKVGFFLTNNAASELRARGIGVEHRVTDGLHTYRLLGGAAGDEPNSVQGSSPLLAAPLSELGDSSTADTGDDGNGQLALHIPRSAYERAA